MSPEGASLLSLLATLAAYLILQDKGLDRVCWPGPAAGAAMLSQGSPGAQAVPIQAPKHKAIDFCFYFNK